MLITDLFTVFHQGKELANAQLWRDRQQAGNKLFTVLSAGTAVAVSMGYKISLDAATLQALAGGIAAAYGVVNVLLHTATHADAGLSPPTGAGVSEGSNPGRNESAP